jgi:hypothetical protein
MSGRPDLAKGQRFDGEIAGNNQNHDGMEIVRQKPVTTLAWRKVKLRKKNVSRYVRGLDTTHKRVKGHSYR